MTRIVGITDARVTRCASLPSAGGVCRSTDAALDAAPSDGGAPVAGNGSRGGRTRSVPRPMICSASLID